MKFSNEPVVWMAVLRAGVVMASTFGLKLTPEQTAAVYIFFEAVLTLIARQSVTPNQLAEQRVDAGLRPTEKIKP